MNNYTTLTRYKAATPRSARRQKGYTVPTISLPSGNSVSLGGVVMLSGEQTITSIKDFLAGIKIGGLSVYKSQADTIYLDANLVVRGGITAFGTNKTITASIFEALPIDGATLKRTENGVLYVDTTVVGGGGGTGITSSMVTNALGYMPLSTSGGTITGEVIITAAANSPLKINSNATDSGVYFNHNGISKTWVGFEASRGSVLYHSVGSHRLGINNDGVAFYDSNTLLHSGNYSEYAVKKNMGINTAIADNEYGYGYYDGGWPEAGPAMVFGVGNYKAGVQVGAFGSAIRYGYTAGATSFTWRTILDENNYSNYALPLTGGTVDGSLHIGGSLYPTNIKYYGSGKVIWHNDESHYFIDCPNGVLTYQAYSGHSFLGGNVGIGGTTASEKLHVYGNMLFEGERVLKSSLIGEVLYMGGSFLVIGGGTTTKGIPTYIDGKTVYVRAGNYVATFSDAGGLTWNGNLLTNGAITMYYSSDERLKKNIRKVNASEVLMSLGGIYQYEYIDSEVAKNSTYGGSHFGLIYQNVKGTALNKMCFEREDGFGTLNYLDTNFISIIAGATMENISEVEKLKRKIRTLENKVKQLERVA